MGFLTDKDEKRQKVLDPLYHHFKDSHVAVHAKTFGIMGLLSMIFLAPFDYLLFSNPIHYLRVRLLIVAGLLALLLALGITQSLKFYQDAKKIRRASLILLLEGMWMNGVYLYYLVAAPTNEHEIVLIGNIMVVVFTTIVMARFDREQIALNLWGLFSCIALITSYSELHIKLLLLMICHAVVGGIAIFMRREFKNSLYERYENLRNFIPKKEAMLIAVTDDREALYETFKPVTRFSVCLCADWRNYQSLARTIDPERLANYFEIFYESIFEELEKISPEGNYYVSWVADELFVIFYGLEDTPEATMQTALKFARCLADPIFNNLRERLDLELRFDIGMAAGTGLLGLQGPRGMKKTTITSENAGIAKRLETQAKMFRKASATPSIYPILMLDSELARVASKTKLIESKDLTAVKALVKDLSENESYFMFWKQATAEPEIKISYFDPARHVFDQRSGLHSLPITGKKQDRKN